VARNTSADRARDRSTARGLNRRRTGVLRLVRIGWKAFCYGIGLFVLTLAGVQAWFYAHVLWWNSHNPSSTSFMQVRLDQLREKDRNAKLKHQWLAYPTISAHLKRAVVAAEDAKFVGHEGFDWEAIQKAMEKNERKGRVVAGASTISQQLAKNLFLSGQRSWVRKAQEAAITWMLESVMSKRRILELYLNVAEWGDGVFGAEAAARHHFGIPAQALSAHQAAWLAAILPSPLRYARGHSTAYLNERVAIIQGRMQQARIP
jgi:monofunctional biosynthetic peptidoglycan transglycosylase